MAISQEDLQKYARARKERHEQAAAKDAEVRLLAAANAQYAAGYLSAVRNLNRALDVLLEQVPTKYRSRCLNMSPHPRLAARLAYLGRTYSLIRLLVRIVQTLEAIDPACVEPTSLGTPEGRRGRQLGEALLGQVLEPKDGKDAGHRLRDEVVGG